jgi:hypothetical protein
VKPARAAKERALETGAAARLLPPDEADTSPDIAIRFLAPGVYRLAIDGTTSVRSNWVAVTVTE